MAEPARVEAFDPPEIKRPHRLRPLVQGSVAADVAEALRAEHAGIGGPFGHVLERVLRRGLGLPERTTP